MNLSTLIQALSDPQNYPGPAASVEVHQTHISIVFLAGPYAYKIKKPVGLSFVDYSTLEKRRHWCEEEVRLNRRLAPDVYLGVVPIALQNLAVAGEGEPRGEPFPDAARAEPRASAIAQPDSELPRLRVEGDGPVIEWAVKMRRLPETATLRFAVESDHVDRATIEEVARRIADFHRRAERDDQTAEFSRFEVVAQNAQENFEESAPDIGTTVSADVFDRLRALTETTLGRLRPIIEERVDRRVTCDTHGDLRLEHVYLFPERDAPGDLVIVDCIEFNPRFRAADPIADMAFLMMDLLRRGRRDLAACFRDAYFEASRDDEGRALVPFYISYRSAVRAKVHGMKARENEVGAVERSRARAAAIAHWLLALGALEELPYRPCLVLVGGLPGTGKSTLAHALAAHAGFRVIRSDLVRKELAGASGEDLGPAQFGASIYTPDWNERTYRECARRAEASLFGGKRTLIDATFRDEAARAQLLDVARRLSVPGLLFVCQADVPVVKDRLDQRRNDASDADWAIYLETVRRWEPLSERTGRFAHPIDTALDSPSPLVQALEVLRACDLWD